MTEIVRKKFSEFKDSNRLFIYQSSRLINEEESVKIETDINASLLNWNAHGMPLKAKAQIAFGYFLFIALDEEFEEPSGCSMDKLARMISDFGQKYNTDFLNRLNVIYALEDKLILTSLNKIRELISLETLTENTLIFNYAVENIGDISNKWMIPLKNSWLSKYLQSV